MTPRRTLGATLALAALALSILPAAAQEPPTAAPWNGQPISPGLGPTYGETWCAPPAPGTSIANQQGSPLALVPQEAVGCTLEKIEQEGAAKGLPDRMERFVIGTSANGHDIHAAVVNAQETPEQRRDYERWQQIRALEMEDPAAAQALLATFGADVKMPVFVQANIHGNEEEGADAMLQALRDLVTTPRGQSAMVDQILDHTILIVIPMINPDGRLAGTRANGNSFDMNRDWLVQSQAEVRASVKLQQEWLATAGLDLHGYVAPTLIDGLTKPHNPGIEYDIFLKWNQPRLDANTVDLAGVGMGITRPVNMYNQAGAPPGHPYLAEGWDDWGPFYTQTYMAFYGVDSSTVEMCSSQAGGNCNGRLGSKIAQYVTFYSSMRRWIADRQQMMNDQLEVFRRGATGAARPACCSETTLTARGFTEDQHNWMVPVPTAYVIPFGDDHGRSKGEANRLVRWLLDNGVRVSRATEPFTDRGKDFPAGSYVVWMNQPLRGIALTALSAGQDISNRITQLYATPAAWSHGLLWGADVVEVPATETFAPETEQITAPNELTGGVSGGAGAPADWYAVTPRGVSDHRAIFDLLRGGVAGELAEEPFATETAPSMPAGSVIFPADAAEALDEAGLAAGLTFERAVGNEKPPTTALDGSPRVAILVNSASPSPTDTSESLEAIFGTDAGFVSVTSGSGSLQNGAEDPLSGYDVIYNTGQGWPAAGQARDRLTAFFERGGGYLATNTGSFSFLANAGLVSGSLTQSSQSAYGGIAIWDNAGGAQSPVTGIVPATDFLYLPSNVTYFTATPEGSVIEGRYHADMTGPATSPNGPSAGFVAGLWRTRGAAANGAPVIARGTTSAGGRYVALATNPFSRHDAEREWALIAQAALWSDLTGEPLGDEAGGGSAGFSLPAGVPPGSPAVPSLAGEWRGEWRGSDGSFGYVDATLGGSGRTLTGRVSMAGCTGRAVGALNGPGVRLTAGRLVLDGVAEGGTITGSYRCGEATGTFEMYMEETRASD
ncbi:MAG TPA: M14 family zinc carboxypeptidase [Actinomycetota bacterium]